MSKETLRRVLHPEIKIIDLQRGIVEYVASDETLDSYREIILAAGWKFDLFKKNAPFVDSHDYSSIEKQVGKVLDFNVKEKRLVETVQWATDVQENKLAQLGWKMTAGGYLKAVSVGFFPVAAVSCWDGDSKPFNAACAAAEADPKVVRTIYTSQQQIELSSCIIGANSNALLMAKALKDCVITESEITDIFQNPTHKTDPISHAPGRETESTMSRAQSWFLERVQRACKRL